MSEFRKVGTLPDGDEIGIKTDWDENDCYVIFRKSEIPAEIKDRSHIVVERNVDHFSIMKFYEVDGTKIIFKDIESEFNISIDVMNPINRRDLLVYAVGYFDFMEGTTDMLASEMDWFKIEHMVFDRNFFKIGHAYKIKLTAIPEEPPVYALLKNVTCKELQFIWINDLNDHTDVKATIISARKYNQRNPEKWFFAIDPDDKWTDEIKKLNKPRTQEGAPLCDYPSLTD